MKAAHCAKRREHEACPLGEGVNSWETTAAEVNGAPEAETRGLDISKKETLMMNHYNHELSA